TAWYRVSEWDTAGVTVFHVPYRHNAIFCVSCAPFYSSLIMPPMVYDFLLLAITALKSFV
ncbi:MAG: hypothetical protein KAJ19_19050, partial [Gammaproteobacteria bacterium]|nr:hypothetical protein [Gammaproteobacteria bacterium]